MEWNYYNQAVAFVEIDKAICNMLRLNSHCLIC